MSALLISQTDQPKPTILCPPDTGQTKLYLSLRAVTTVGPEKLAEAGYVAVPEHISLATDQTKNLITAAGLIMKHRATR